MRRIKIEKRPNATRLVQSQGLVYSYEPSPPSSVMAPASKSTTPSRPRRSLLEAAGQDVFAMCCEAADYLIAASWAREPAWGSVYGRFDFYEFNADTPTSLVEAATIQWQWLEQTGHGRDQFNALTERLVPAWRRNLALIEQGALGGCRPAVVHFAASRGEPSGRGRHEHHAVDGDPIFMDQIGQSKHDGRFYDHKSRHLDVVFKLYPWEWMVEQPFGEACFRDMERGEDVLLSSGGGQYTGGTVWIEAPYKMVWSNKGLFAVLWQLFRDDPRSKWLLTTYFEAEAPASLTRYARKPLLAREGADVTLHFDGQVLDDTQTGQYGKEGYVLQELAVLPAFRDDRQAGLQKEKEKEKGKDEQDVDVPTTYYPVLGLWFVDGEPAGMGIREDTRKITANGSWFIRHSISDGEVTYERKPVPDAAEIQALLTLENYQDLTSNSNGVLDYIEGITRE
ncbi:glutathionylspermidine synthase [Apiospora phragmitis]|uniref:Glutathionylspermidine synthase n=1 Tax=Apiospora phragmitis TaxID=2905665 RepID=A0ABR1TS23_9PEZI